LQALFQCNEKIALQNYERFQEMDLNKRCSVALLSYDGIAFQYMAPQIFTKDYFEYVSKHLRILSAFYGVLKPFDAIMPYRLEMQAKPRIGNTKNLYEYWGDLLYKDVRDESGIIINLASKEYSKSIEKYLSAEDTYITITFCELVDGRLVTKGTYAKMARGEMVRYMAENGIENPVEIKCFNRLGYIYRDDLSSETEYVFERRL
jgi:cytoplasmic iron level regulating protein YaaA (DUF328/UPF0246 family)